jgi:hypothetical protein
MKSRVFLIAALLASSAWAQEHSFDLRGDAAKKIIRDTAAAQSALVQLEGPKPVERKTVLQAEDLRPLETPAKIAPPRRVAAKSKQPGPISALVDVLVDHALGTDDTPIEPRFCLSDVKYKKMDRGATCRHELD